MTGQFRAHVDKLIALVKERGTLTIDAAAYELNLSPNYVQKMAEAAASVSGGGLVCRGRYLHTKSEHDKIYQVHPEP